MSLTKEEKLQVIKQAANDAREKIMEAYYILHDAQNTTGYLFDPTLMGEFDSEHDHIFTITKQLKFIENGVSDSAILKIVQEDQE